MIYVHVETSYTYKPELFIAKDEEEMLGKLKKRFRLKKSQSSNFTELEKELEDLGRGYHGAADLYFDVITPDG